MNNEEMVEKAKAFATDAHDGQTRWGGEPYITHPAAVAAKVAHLGPAYEAVAWLHDVMEDCEVTDHDLYDEGFPPVVVDAVLILTKGCETYLEYILRAKANPLARAVKLADVEHNLETSDPHGRTHKGKGGKTMREKWMLAKYILETEIRL